MSTKIEWTWAHGKTGETWNPIRGCTPAPGDPACHNCYAENMAGRFDKPGLWGDGLTTLRANGERRWSGKVVPHVPALAKPLHWRKPRGVFVNSTSDVWHEKLMATEEGRRYIAAIFGVMAACPQHTFMILTKRPHMMREWFEWAALAGASGDGRGDTPSEFCRAESLVWIRALGLGTRIDALNGYDQRWPLPNVWLGATTGTQATADKRIPDLLRTPAAVRFLSCEPLLGPIDLSAWIRPLGYCGNCGHRGPANPDCCPACESSSDMSWTTTWGDDLDTPAGPPLDWVITGGESGRKARPSHPDWFRSIRDQCVAAGVPHFFKQWGEWAIDAEADDVMNLPGFSEIECKNVHVTDTPRPVQMRRVGKSAAGRLLDGREWSEFPDV